MVKVYKCVLYSHSTWNTLTNWEMVCWWRNVRVREQRDRAYQTPSMCSTETTCAVFVKKFESEGQVWGVKALLSSFWFGMGSKTCTGKQFPCYSHPFDTCVIWHWRTQNLRCICTLYVLDSLQQQRQSLRAPKTWRWLTSDSQWLTVTHKCRTYVRGTGAFVCVPFIMFRKYVDCNKGIYMCKGASIICVRVGMEIFNETTVLTTQLGGGEPG